MSNIEWITDWDVAFERAKRRATPVYIDFNLPECIGCRMMASETYNDEEVAGAIMTRTTALRVHADALPHSEDYCVRWTPFLAMAMPDGRQLQKAAGFQAAAELTPWILLGQAKFDMVMRRWLEAMNHLELIISLHSKSAVAAEAVFMRGVAGYRQSKQPLHLKSAYQKLIEEYSNSVWAGRARPYKDF